jgi:hypothetical protein
MRLRFASDPVPPTTEEKKTRIEQGEWLPTS